MCKFEPDHDLYRVIVPLSWSKKDNRPSSSAFKHLGMSVDWCLFSNSYESLRRYVKDDRDKIGSGVAALTVKQAKDYGQDVCHEPEENNYSHSLILGKKTDSIARKLARIAGNQMKIDIQLETFKTTDTQHKP